MQMKTKPFGSILIFTLGDGGGELRFVALDETHVLLMNLTEFLDAAQKGQPRRHNRPDHHINGQDTANVVSKQGGVPRIHHNRKHPKGDSSETIPPRPDTPRLPPCDTVGTRPKQEQPAPVSCELISRLHGQSPPTVGACWHLRRGDGKR